jgi:hypothetical protein
MKVKLYFQVRVCKINSFSDPIFLRDLDYFRIFSRSKTVGTSGYSGWDLVPFFFEARVSNVESPGENILHQKCLVIVSPSTTRSINLCHST